MRRRIMASVGGKQLPYDAEVSCIEALGDAHVNTLVNSYHLEIEVKAKVCLGNATKESYVFFFGIGGVDRFYVGKRRNEYKIFTYNSNPPVVDVDKIYDVDLYSNYIDQSLRFVISSNGSEIYNYVLTEPYRTVNDNIHLFRLGETNQYIGTGLFLGRTSIFLEGELVRNFIPCLKDGEALFYDEVTKQFFGNASASGSLVAHQLGGGINA